MGGSSIKEKRTTFTLIVRVFERIAINPPLLMTVFPLWQRVTPRRETGGASRKKEQASVGMTDKTGKAGQQT